MHYPLNPLEPLHRLFEDDPQVVRAEWLVERDDDGQRHQTDVALISYQDGTQLTLRWDGQRWGFAPWTN